MNLDEVVQCLPKSIIEEYTLNSYREAVNYIFNNIDMFYLDEVTVYHGSYNSNLIPTYNYGKSYNDYGKGLYTTLEVEKAKEWAHIDELTSGYLYAITLDMSDLTVFNFNKEPTYVWLAELIKHRTDIIECKNKGDLQTFVDYYGKDIDADLVYGWRADSSFYTIIDAFINGNVAYNAIDKYLLLGNLGYQLFIKSQKAFNRITSVKNLGKVTHHYFDRYNLNLGNAINTLYDLISKESTVAKAISFEQMVRDADE